MATWKMVGETTFDQGIAETSAAITDSNVTPLPVPLGSRVQARDIDNPGYGDMTFVYCKGVASTAAGDLVLIDGAGFTTSRPSANAVGKCGVAMSANVANQYGWYCIDGTVAITSGDVADGAQLYLTATASSVDDAVVAGDVIYGAYAVAADSGGTTLSSISHPFVNNVSN